MTLEEIQVKLQQATEEQQKGNATKVKILSQEILVHLDSFQNDLNSEKQSENTTEMQTIRAKALYLLGYCSSIFGEYDTSIQYFQTSISISQQLNLQENIANCYNGLGNTYKNLGEIERSMSFFNNALEIYEDLNIISKVALVKGNIGIIQDDLGLFDKAIENYNFAIDVYETLQDTTSLAKIINYLGNIYLELSSMDKALEYYTRSLSLGEESGNKMSIAIALSNIGNIYNKQGTFQFALEYYNKALAIYENIGEKSQIAAIFSVIGIVYKGLGSYDLAIEYQRKSLDINQQIKNKKGVSNNIINIGVIYGNLQSYNKAIDYYSEALSILEEIGDISTIIHCKLQIALVYIKKEQFELANNLLLELMPMVESLGIKKHIVNCYSCLGSTHLGLNNTKEAKKYFEKAIDIQKNEIRTDKNIANLLISLGEVCLFEQDYNQAISYLNESLELSTKTQDKVQICKGHKYLAEVYSQLHNWQKSDYHFRQFYEIEKSLQNNEALLSVERFDIERKAANREKELAIERARFLERESILKNILPDSVTNRLVKGENPIADHFQSATVLFFDIVGFTALSSIIPPKQLVYLLDNIFSKADEIVESFGLEKIKTIGDGYLAVANVTTPHEEHQKATALAALQLLETMKDLTVNIPSELGETEWINNMNDIEIRIGIHNGEVVAGIIGKNKYTYDLWGDAVNVASRMESYSEAGRIHVSEEFAKSITSYPEFKLTSRGEITVKGKGTMKTFWLEKVI